MYRNYPRWQKKYNPEARPFAAVRAVRMHASAPPPMALWSVKLGGIFQKYDAAVSEEIEESFQKGKTECRVTVRGQTYTIDFGAMKQRLQAIWRRMGPILIHFGSSLV